MTTCLFVYGSLGLGRLNEHVLNDIGGTWIDASVNGYLKEEGWGAELGYPGIVLDNEGNEVDGYLFCSDNLEHHWDNLDAFEGDEYQRILVTVKTKSRDKVDHTEVEAYIYVLADN